MHFIKKVLFFMYFLCFFTVVLFSQEQKSYKFPPVKYVSIVEDLSEYYLYANGGFHADWYIGFNNAWIVKLPPVDTTGYIDAYIGVKIGRAKNKSYPDSYDLEPTEGKIMASISQSPVFPSQSYVVAENTDIPMEPLQGEAVKNVTSSKWFWSEIPLNKISSDKENYIAVWAQSSSFIDSSKAPIIAAAYLDDGLENVWVNHLIKGSLPTNESSLDTPISGIKPAIVIKLISENDYKVVVKNFKYNDIGNNYIFNWNVIGTDISKSWIEISYDRLEWRKFSGYIYEAPYFISFLRSDMPKDIFYLRACANDIYENTGCSNYISMNLIVK